MIGKIKIPIVKKNNPEKRIAMANAMHEHFMKTCAPRIWWENIFTWSKDK